MTPWNELYEILRPCMQNQGWCMRLDCFQREVDCNHNLDLLSQIMAWNARHRTKLRRSQIHHLLKCWLGWHRWEENRDQKDSEDGSWICRWCRKHDSATL